MNKLLRFCLAVLLVLVARGAAAFEQTTYYHDDIFGSPVAATDAAGNVLWKESYAPYGDRTKKQDQGSNEVWFHGKPTDIESGLSYFGARYYDPVVGRFMGIDPARFDESNIHSFNKYAYGNNNPYRYRDPNGRSPIDIAFLIYDVGKLALAIRDGGEATSALADVGLSAAGVVIPIPFVGEGLKAAKGAEHLVAAAATAVTAERAVDAERGTAHATEAFHYTFAKYLGSIEANGLRQGTYATRSGTLSPLQAQIELALPANRGLPNALVRIDLAGMRQAGYEIPELTRVSSRFGLPGGGYEMQFPYPIPSQFISVVP
jgi:RHS repeat-associated protein